jgi:hypothetical protein
VIETVGKLASNGVKARDEHQTTESQKVLFGYEFTIDLPRHSLTEDIARSLRWMLSQVIHSVCECRHNTTHRG